MIRSDLLFVVFCAWAADASEPEAIRKLAAEFGESITDSITLSLH